MRRNVNDNKSEIILNNSTKIGQNNMIEISLHYIIIDFENNVT